MKHQRETIQAMVDDQQSKLVTLAEHIVEHGLNPTDVVLVEPHENQWLILEGNRRITAIKLINNPELLSDKHSRLKRDFQRLKAALGGTLIESVPCVIIEDRELSNEWIRLKHTGENAGAGTVTWVSQQSNRFNTQVSGIIDARMAFLDSLRTHSDIPQTCRDAFDKILKTNFDRLIGDPDVRKMLGVSSAEGRYFLTDGVNKYILAVLLDLTSDEALSVGRIYHKADRKKYIEEIKARMEQPTLVSVSTIQIDDRREHILRAADIDEIDDPSSDRPNTVHVDSLSPPIAVSPRISIDRNGR